MTETQMERRPDVHHLKIKPQYFSAVETGAKTFEIRQNDRDYYKGDVVILKEWDGEYTGQELSARIGFITDFEQKPGYVVFSLKEVKHHGR